MFKNILIISIMSAMFVSCGKEELDPQEQEYRNSLAEEPDNSELKAEFAWYLITREQNLEDKKRSREHLLEAFNMLDELTSQEKDSTYLAMKGTAAALIASTYGFEEPANASKYIYLSTQIFNEAEAIDPDDFMLWINRGFSYTGFPALFGKWEQGYDDLKRVASVGTDGLDLILVKQVLESLIRVGTELGEDVSMYEQELEAIQEKLGEE